MPGRDEELRLRLTAKDEASPVIDKVGDKVERLDKEDVSVTLTATDKAEAVIKDVETRLKNLSAEDQAIVLRASSKEFTKAVSAAQRDLKNLRDLSDDDVTLRIRVIEENRAALVKIDAQLDALDKRVVTPEVRVQQTGRGTAALGGLSNALSAIPGEAGAAASALGSAVTPTQALGAAALIAGTALTKMATGFGDTALEVDAFARTTGLSAEEASRFVAVADDLGIATEGISTAMQKMQKNIGGGLLEKLGLDALRGADTQETFLNIVGYLQSIDDEAQQAALGAQIFGKGFAGVSELMLTDVRELKESLADIEAGQIYDDEDIVKGKALRASADELSDRFEIINRELGESFLPFLVQAETTLTGIVSTAESLASALGALDFNVPGLDRGALDIGTDFIPGVRAAKDLGVILGENVDNVDRLKAAVSGVMPVLGLIPGGFFDVESPAEKAAEAAEDLAESIAAIAAAHEAGAAAGTATVRSIEGLSDAYGEESSAAERAATALETKAKADEFAAETAKEHAEAEERVKEAIDRVNEALAERSGAILGEAELRVQLADSQADYAESLKDEKQSTDERTVAAIDSANAYADLLEAQARANGESFTTTQRNAAIKASLEELAKQADGPTKDAINNVIGALDDVPPEVPIDMSADPTAALAGINAVIRQLQILKDQASVMAAIGAGGNAGNWVLGAGPRSSPSSVPPTVIINMPPGTNGSDVVREQNRYARRNGGLAARGALR